MHKNSYILAILLTIPLCMEACGDKWFSPVQETATAVKSAGRETLEEVVASKGRIHTLPPAAAMPASTAPVKSTIGNLAAAMKAMSVNND